MSRKSQLAETRPFEVDAAITRLGANLRTARIRRGLTLQVVAEKIGVRRLAVADAEKGKPTTGIALYFALLWAYDLIDEVAGIADPAADRIGQALMRADEKQRVRSAETLDDDF